MFMIIMQIADFGMSRDLSDGDYYMSQGGKIPVKWTAPEVWLCRSIVSIFCLHC